MRSIRVEVVALLLCAALVLLLSGGGPALVSAQNLRAMPVDVSATAFGAGIGSSGGVSGSPKPIVTCCDEPRLMSVSGEAEQTVTNTITKVVLSIRVTDSIPIDTTPAIDINLQQQLMAAGIKPTTGTGSSVGSGMGSTASQLPTAPTAKQLDTMARTVMQNATARTSNVLALLQATSAERLQTQGVSLQPTSVWVPKLSQSINNGYAASNTITFRIASAAMGTLLVDVLRLGATNIDSVTHTATEADLEKGRRAAIRVATRRALARAQLTAGAMVSKPRLDINNVAVSVSGSSGPRPPMVQPVMFAMRAEVAAAPAPPISTDVAGETELVASVSLQVQVLDYSAINTIDPNDLN